MATKGHTKYKIKVQTQMSETQSKVRDTLSERKEKKSSSDMIRDYKVSSWMNALSVCVLSQLI